MGLAHIVVKDLSMGEGNYKEKHPTSCNELDDLRETVTKLVERMATLEERLSTSDRGRAYLKKSVEEGKKAAQDADSSLMRIGGHITHEDHHREIARLLKDKATRADIFNKVLGDVFSKSTIGLLMTLVALVGYIGTQLGLWR